MCPVRRGSDRGDSAGQFDPRVVTTLGVLFANGASAADPQDDLFVDDPQVSAPLWRRAEADGGSSRSGPQFVPSVPGPCKSLNLNICPFSADKRNVTLLDPCPKRYIRSHAGAPHPDYLTVSPRTRFAAEEDKHILIIDDDPFFRSLLKVMLAQTDLPLGHICEAEESQTALALCREYPFDLIFCDIHLPAIVSKNGIQVVQEIRNIRPNSPIYMVTGDNEEAVIREVFSSGATGYILKPVNLRILKRILAANFGPGSPSFNIQDGNHPIINPGRPRRC
jgi:CheY-like chemotaxis protein